jgi:hypothetical protein
MRFSAAGFFGGVFAAILSCGPAQAASVADWRHDIDTIVTDLRTVHPNAFSKTPLAVFLRAAAALKASLPRLSEEQRMVRAMELVALVGDGHTQLAPNRPDFSLWYPWRTYEFTDGYFITAAYKSNADLAGAQILSIAGRPAAEVFARARKLMDADNAFDAKERLYAVSSAPLMKGLGYAAADGTLKITVRLAGGAVAERTLVPLKASDSRYDANDSTFDWTFASEIYGPPIGSLDDWVTAYKALPTSAYRTIDVSRPPHFTYRRPFLARGMPEANAYYIQNNGVGDWNEKTYEDFFRKALAEVDVQKPANLIVDLRYNGGGDGSKVPAMIHQFIKREDNPPWKHLYILVGRKTFSAAIMALAAFIDNTRCTLIGEPPGSPLDNFGDPTVIDLARTGVELDISMLYHQLEDQGARYPIVPVDVPAPFSFADYAAGRDPAVDAILRGDEMRSIPIIATEDGAAAARRVYEARKARFGGWPEWSPPREIDLIHAFWKLNDSKRTSDALDFAKLYAGIYPGSARAWSYLGDARIAAGDKAGGLSSYQRALQLDPNNHDNVTQRQALRDAKMAVPE